ncbi:MAG: type II toxin-antitoxin system prevent-host-death family antitoxin [Cyanobacteria bacterium M_surface_9_m1_291]|nr:type II toxin-antitoxin system prevent-host-death family antitoxin [Cyanobacteria bacterium M_surface_9_m1_291]
MPHQTVVSVAEARRSLSALLDRVWTGEVVLISRRGRPLAELSALRPRQADAGVWLQRLQELHCQSN